MRIVVIISTLLIFNSNILAQDHSPFLREGPIGRPVCDVGERDPYPVVCWDGEAVVFLPAERGSVSRREDLEIARRAGSIADRSEEHTSELQSRGHLVCRLLLEKKIGHEVKIERQ